MPATQAAGHRRLLFLLKENVPPTCITFVMKSFFVTLMLVMISCGLVVAEEVGFLFVFSDPQDATLIVDNDRSNPHRTPVLCTLSTGQHELILEMEHFRPETTSVTITANKVTRRKITFVAIDKIKSRPAEEIKILKQYGTLTVITDIPNAAVFIDGANMNEKTPVTLTSVTAGEHLVTLDLNGLVFDTTVLILPDRTEILAVDLSELAERSRYGAGGKLVDVVLNVTIPGCEYKRDYDKRAEKSNIAIRGADAMIQVACSLDAREYSHRTLAQDETFDHRGFATSKNVPDTLIIDTLSVFYADSVRIGTRVFANTGMRFKDRDHMKPTVHSYVFPADFNSGGLITVRLRVLPDGTVSFRYY